MTCPRGTGPCKVQLRMTSASTSEFRPLGAPSQIESGLLAPLRTALLDSRQRWRDLVSMAADFVFETDEHGRFSFVMPDPALGWDTATLIGQPVELLLADPTNGFNPFRLSEPIRRQRAWLKRADGTSACVLLAAAPLLNARGRPIGVRGLGMDISEQDSTEAQVAAVLRRSAVLDHILALMRTEVEAPRMMRRLLNALAKALGAEGAAVIRAEGQAPATLAHEAGGCAAEVLAAAASILERAVAAPARLAAEDGRPVMVCGCDTRFGGRAGLALWRTPGSRDWDSDDITTADAAMLVVRVVLEQESLQEDMARQARTDPLTGLYNRRAFLEELPRHLERLDREDDCGTLMFVDLDNFKPVNDQLGHQVGDQVLTTVAIMLRNLVRPTDVVARLGGDEFAVWMNGADHMTAAERAEQLRIMAPRLLADVAPGLEQPLSMSIGIACRPAGSHEMIESIMRRADMAMYQVKRSGRGHWRVSHEAGT
jgi:diguanylate cyclase (GGDEF)-like protein/PAS domain S-box-containing protein